MAQYDAVNVAACIICYCNDNNLPINNPRLQKILYFTQAEFLIEKGSACFSDDIEVWPTGPVVPDVYRMYYKFGSAHLYASVDFAEKKDLLIAAVNTDNYRVLECLNHYDTRTGWCSKRQTKYHIPILNSSGLVGGIAPLEIYLSIEEYLSFEKTASERTESIGLTDKERIKNHGFDVKRSFRGKPAAHN